MIIKKIRIKAFGGIKDKDIDLTDGINLIYGENEKGKSTVENFIRAWLFGFTAARGGKNNLRKRYMPFTGEKMQGELLVSHDGKEYIIARTFGNTKKEDTSVIYDGLTGEEIKDINKDEPGTYFLGVNGNTFVKTLFIPQLGISFAKDREEQIMDKIIDVFGCGEGEVSAYKAILKLKDNKKSLTTTRGNGELDILKSRYNKVIEERYEAYKIAEENLEDESELINKKEERKTLRDEINKLELFKKYLKKSKLQKEYGEITNYLKKSENLKRQEKELENELKREKGYITEDYINELSEENKKYLTLLDIKKENEYDLKELEEKIERETLNINGYEVFKDMEDGLKEKLIRLNIEQEALKEKVMRSKALKLSIKDEENKLAKKKQFLGDIIKLTPHREKIKSLFKEYEDNLHRLKEEIESGNFKDSDKDAKKALQAKKNISCAIAAIGLVIFIYNIASSNSTIMYIIAAILFALGGISFAKINSELKYLYSSYECEKKIESLNVEIKKIEDKLNDYLKLIECKDYENLLRAVSALENFYMLETKVKLRIEERTLQLEQTYSEKDMENYNKNNKMILQIMKLCGCDTIDEIYLELDAYEKVKREIEVLNLEKNSKSESLERISFELEEKEKGIKEKLEIMDLDHIKLVDLEMYLKEFRNKLEGKKDLEKALASVEETYKVLLKDRDIENIREELSDILRDDMEYSYESEEEIEQEVKLKSNKLIAIEKIISDLENDIKNSFLGKRTINAIEEDLENLVNDIKSSEKRLLAINMAIENLEIAGRELRESFGPTLNNKILEAFKEVTGEKYSEVKLGENYDMAVRDEYNIFSGEYLSNGANDQLYLALRIAFIELIFKSKEVVVILDDAFIQYDDIRREKALNMISNRNFAQTIIFTCQSIEEEILKKNNIKNNYISI
ncbi:MAG: AAA family ATPase [Clostridium sp.]|uniref:AAA family ATPase n=1 Tax=Clostridium sp. TaxID=1506 RepID=UPI003F38B938